MSELATARPPIAPYRLTAFGLDIDSDVALPGATTATGEQPRAGATRVGELPTAHFDAEYERPATMLWEPEYPDGQSRVKIDRSRKWYRLWFDGFGRYLVSRDGTEVACEHDVAALERTQRVLLAQAFPLAAALRGYEVLHASAVGTGDGVAAFVGPSGMGKTTLAAGLVSRGATFVTDDVLAVERGQGVPLAYPGPPLMVLVDDPARPVDWDAVGAVTGQTDKAHIAVEPAAGPMPLRRLYYLERSDDLSIAPFDQMDIRLTLGCVFAPYLTSSGRLRRHLDTMRLLSGTVRQFRLSVPRTGRFEDLLEAVETHLQEPVKR